MFSVCNSLVQEYRMSFEIRGIICPHLRWVRTSDPDRLKTNLHLRLHRLRGGGVQAGTFYRQRQKQGSTVKKDDGLSLHPGNRFINT
jgi:hypothetical protein